MRSPHAWVLIVLLGWSCPAIAAEPPALAKARALYNAGSYEAAIETAKLARSNRQFGDAAALVIGRSYLEQYRLTGNLGDLATARDTLRSIRRAALSSRDQIDQMVGLGQTLFFGDQFGASAELFETALDRAAVLPERDRQLLLDWWATALDREAQSRSPDRRGRLFARITARMEDEIALEPGSAVANYWLVAAARGEGDVERAWDAAVAAWVRASLSPETSTSLRADLERLVTQALIPERARTRPAREDAPTALRVEWERVKEYWK